MRTSSAIFALLLLLSAGACVTPAPKRPIEITKNTLPGEKHFRSLRQLTSGGTNEKARWSFNGKWLSLQHKEQEAPREQIHFMRSDGSAAQPLSTSRGRATDSFFLPDDSRILYSNSPEEGTGSQLYASKMDGSDLRPLDPGAPRAIHSETALCKDGSVIFTSDRDGDFNLYSGKLDHFNTLADVKKFTHATGYDGTASFSPDCGRILWSASRTQPHPNKEVEIWTGRADGTRFQQITRKGALSLAPVFAPDGKRVVFASNLRNPQENNFDLYLIHTNGTHLERITFSDRSDSFPMFSPDGKLLSFSSKRNASQPQETNIFVAEWMPPPESQLSLDDPDPANRIYALTEKLLSSNPGAARDLIAGELKKSALEPIFENGFFDSETQALWAKWGSACATTRPTAILAPLALKDAPSSALTAELIEIARFVIARAKQAKSCFTFVSLPLDTFEAALETKDLPSPRFIISLKTVASLEDNLLYIQTANATPAIRSGLRQSCTDERLQCVETELPKKREARSTTFVTVSTAPHEVPENGSRTLEDINYTGAVQTAEWLANWVLRAATK